MARLRSALSLRRVSALYVLLGLIVLFSIWVPDTFLTTTTLKRKSSNPSAAMTCWRKFRSVRSALAASTRFRKSSSAAR